MDYSFIQNNLWIFVLIGIWELFWKGKAMWRAARNDQAYWFIGIMLINSIGIIAILYLLFFQSRKGK